MELLEFNSDYLAKLLEKLPIQSISLARRF